MPKWNSTAEKLPPINGRYWVYPYRSIGGHLMVAQAAFSDGQWEKTYRDQYYAYWKPIEIPKAPKSKDEKYSRQYE